MKKFIICLITVIILSNIQISCKSSRANDKPRTFWNSGYSWEDQDIKGMKYRVFYRDWASSQTGYAIFVINLTKDSLEIELLKKQLKHEN